MVSLSVETGKMTADLLQKAVKKVLEEMQKKPSQRTLRQGKQTLHQLKQHGASLTNIEITEQNIKAFSAVAKKYDIDYALKKDPHTEPPHYYVFFKAKDKETGINTYRGTIDGKYALFGKPNSISGNLVCELDPKHVEKGGKHVVEMTVTDGCGNRTTGQFEFVW